MNSTTLERSGGKLQTRKQILSLKIGKFSQDIVDGIPPCKILQQGLDGITKAAHHGLSVADFRIDDDAVEEAHWISKRQEPRIVNWGGGRTIPS